MIPEKIVLEVLKCNYEHIIKKPKIMLLQGGRENKTYKVVSSGDIYVLRIYNQANSVTGKRTADSILTELKFTDEVRKLYKNIPKAINTSSGSLLVEIGDNFGALMEYIDGYNPETLDLNTVKSMAEITESTIKASINFHAKPINTITLVERTNLMVQKYKIGRNPEDEFIIKMIENRNLAKLDNLQKGFIHGDIKLENLLFMPNQSFALLDFDDYRYTYLLEEVVLTLMHNIDHHRKSIIRSGYAQDFINSISDERISEDIRLHLKDMLQERFLYSLLKYSIENKRQVIDELLSDKYIQELIFT